jgi:hypothetical protein
MLNGGVRDAAVSFKVSHKRCFLARTWCDGWSVILHLVLLRGIDNY